MKTLLTISISVLLMACAAKPVPPAPPPVTITEIVYHDCGTPPQRDPVDFEPLIWAVLEDSDTPYALSGEGYKTISNIMTTIWNGIKQLRIEIEFYENCVNPAEP